MPPIYQIRCKDLHLSTAGFLRLAAMRFYSLWPKQSKGKILTSVPPNISPLFAKYLPFVCQIFATRFTKQDLQHFSRHLPHLHTLMCRTWAYFVFAMLTNACWSEDMICSSNIYMASNFLWRRQNTCVSFGTDIAMACIVLLPM